MTTPWEEQSTAYERAIEVREVRNGAIFVCIAPGTATPEVIAALLVAMDALHRAHGGNGLEFSVEHGVTMADGRDAGIIKLSGDAEPLALLAAELKQLIARIFGL